MIEMKGMIVYDSSHGNTKKVAETIAETLRRSGLEVDLFFVKKVGKLRAGDYDFIMVGSPTKFGTMTFPIRLFIRRIKEKDWKGKTFAAFDTQNPENIEKGDTCASEKIAEKLKERKMREISPPLKVLVNDWKGPLLDGETLKVEKYAKDLENKLIKLLTKT